MCKGPEVNLGRHGGAGWRSRTEASTLKESDSKTCHLEGQCISSTDLLFVSVCLSNNTKKCFYMKEQLTLLLFIFLREEMKSIEIKSKA